MFHDFLQFLSFLRFLLSTRYAKHPDEPITRHRQPGTMMILVQYWYLHWIVPASSQFTIQYYEIFFGVLVKRGEDRDEQKVAARWLDDRGKGQLLFRSGGWLEKHLGDWSRSRSRIMIRSGYSLHVTANYGLAMCSGFIMFSGTLTAH